MEADEAEQTDEDLQKEWPYLSRQQMEDLREAFEMFDKRKAGAFTSEDLQKVLKDLGEGTSAKDIDNIIAGLDTDGDGVIDFAQFVLVMMHNVRKAEPEKDLQGVFSVFDKSGNGLITQEDLRNAIKSMGSQELSEDDISVALGMVEQKDGQIDYHEFLRLIMSPEMPQPGTRSLKTTDSQRDFMDERRLSTMGSGKGSFKDPMMSSAMPDDSARELRASSSGQEIRPADPENTAARSLIHSKSSKKRAVLASDQQKMASLWSD
ncbi:hypothetical protein WJX84_001918 [Apatococcus fuscideae]|uniref:EF-hand domain-containing protein n=1 Tax=Apatococcus fuscideae TaxID=2026836 RepID=A0AAW1T2T2_9CHLO